MIDPKGDLAADVLDRVPPDRVDDVIVLDPADEAARSGSTCSPARPRPRSCWSTRSSAPCTTC